MLQTSVNTLQGFGVVGSFYDDSPRRVNPYNLLSNPATAVAATGSITIGANPTANDTVTVAGTTYTFKSTASATNDIAIGANATATIANIVAKINATNSFVSAAAGSGSVGLTAKIAGVSGNSIGLSASFTSGSNDVVAFSGGADAGQAVKIGNAFTVSASNPANAIVGGDGVFAGLLASPHEYALGGLDASLELKSGTCGQLCTFGHIVVKSETAVSVGYVAAYNKTTGAISAYSAAGSIPETHAQIANAKFILVSAASNGLAVLELGN